MSSFASLQYRISRLGHRAFCGSSIPINSTVRF
nr:MAG TPA: hypothetical protein [Caudoviricetes sp.]